MENGRFDDLQAGDIVLVEVGVATGWRNYEYFWVPKTVVKITKTQIVLETGRRYKKTNGKLIENRGMWGYGRSEDQLAFPGETQILYGKVKIIEDQTLEMNVFAGKLNDAQKVRKMIDDMGKIRHDHKNFVGIIAHIAEAHRLFKDAQVVDDAE